MDYAQALLSGGAAAKEDAAAGKIDWAAALTKPKSTSPRDVRIANEGTTENTAGFGTLVKSRMVEDPATKIDIFAKSRFPHEPIEQARQRYGVIDGEIVFADNDGKVYRETPSGVPGGMKQFAADLTADLPAIAGGTLGAVAGAPFGPGASAGLAALGAAGGKGYGKAAAALALGEPQTAFGNALAMGKEAAFSGGGTVIGNYLGKVLSGVKARDINRLNLGDVATLDAKAAAQGIDLDVAQRTNLPSMKGRFDTLASLPTSRDTIGEFAKRQNEQANDAVERFLSRVSPIDGIDEAGTMARDATQRVLTKLTQERAAEAAPLYKAAFTGDANLPPRWEQVWSDLLESPTMRTAQRIAQRMEADDLAKNKVMGALGMNDRVSPNNPIRGLHYMKLALDRMIAKEPMSSAASTARKTLVELKTGLVELIDDISPRDQAGESLYRMARQKFAHFSPNIESVKEGVVSRIADLSDEKVMQAAQEMFNPRMSPVAVGRARELFARSGRQEDWDAMLRAYLQESFGKAGRDFVTRSGETGQALRWRAAIVGDKSQLRIMREAMTKPQFDAMMDMADVFEAMSRTYASGAGSQTMSRQEAAKVLRDEATGMIPKALTPINSFKEWLQEVRLGNYAEKMAAVMTSKDGIKRLKELARMSPNEQKFLSGVSSLFGISAVPVASPNQEQVPQALQ